MLRSFSRYSSSDMFEVQNDASEDHVDVQEHPGDHQ